MRVCCVPGCDSRYTPKGIGFHHLPQGLRNEERRRLWEKNIGQSLTSKSVVCDKHFTSDQYEQNRKDGKKPLKWYAVPTIFSMQRLNRLHKVNNTPRGYSIALASSAAPITIINTEEPPAKCEEKQQVKLVQQVMIPFDQKQLAQIKKETPPGCIPILPKYDPSLYVSVKKSEIEDYKKDIQKYKVLTEIYTNKVNKLISNIKSMSKEKEKGNVSLKRAFNDDQLKCLLTDKPEDEAINWGYKTIDKAVELFKACGEDGYKVILSQKLPYPSLNLLRKLKPELFTT